MTCESGKCTKQAVYHCNIKSFGNEPDSYTRDYCPEHTRQLTDGMAKVMANTAFLAGEKLHNYLEIEHVREPINV